MFAHFAPATTPWYGQAFAGILIGCGIILVFMGATYYLIEVYMLDINSALAINIFVRSFMAAALPFVAGLSIKADGVASTANLLGYICCALVPFPFVAWIFGSTIRGWSRFALAG